MICCRILMPRLLENTAKWGWFVRNARRNLCYARSRDQTHTNLHLIVLEDCVRHLTKTQGRPLSAGFLFCLRDLLVFNPTRNNTLLLSPIVPSILLALALRRSLAISSTIQHASSPSCCSRSSFSTHCRSRRFRLQSQSTTPTCCRSKA